jgi:hypothetical protein
MPLKFWGEPGSQNQATIFSQARLTKPARKVGWVFGGTGIMRKTVLAAVALFIFMSSALPNEAAASSVVYTAKYEFSSDLVFLALSLWTIQSSMSADHA